MIENLSPIVLFVYNRPWHTEQTLLALEKNELANKSSLFIYCDGPKLNATDDENFQIEKVRALVKSKKWCKEVKIIESTTNKGLAESIMNGVSEIVNKYEKIIVLEDDIVTSPGFLKFMNQSLDIFYAESKVMHISGYSYPIKFKSNYFIFPGGTCWGWATWKSAWKYLEKNPEVSYQKIKDENRVKEFNFNGSNNLFHQLERNVKREIKTWAILWRASIFLHDGCTFYPETSLVQNIGHDGSGQNSGYNNDLMNQNIALYVPVEKLEIEADKITIKKIERYYQKQYQNTGFLIKFINKFIFFR